MPSPMEKMKWNVQGKGIFIGHFISLIKGEVEKYLTKFRIYSHTINMRVSFVS
jgi:hypothetical protein